MIKRKVKNNLKAKLTMAKNNPNFVFYLACYLTIIFLVLFISLSYFTAQERQLSYTIEMQKAEELADRAMQAIKQAKIAQGEEFPKEDILSTGLIEKKGLTAISTTDGNLQAKRTSCNSDWAGLTIRMFKKAGLKKGDQIGLVFSGSFPAINICVLAAAESYGLEFCLMESFGASTHGATNVEFTFFDMTEYLVDQGIFTHRADVISFGGNDDIGSDFQDEDNILIPGTRTAEEIRSLLRERAEKSSSQFIYEKDYVKNINTRLEIFENKVPNMKLFINVGGSQVGLGLGSQAYLSSGYKKASDLTFSRIALWEKTAQRGGLINYFSSCGLDVMNYLNIKGLAEKYQIPFDPQTQEEKESGKVDYEKIISPIFPTLATLTGIGGMIIICVIRRKDKKRRNEVGKVYFS